jgi:hypothetical protein
MMIVIYGTRTQKSKEVKAGNLRCESCEKTGTTNFQYFQEYYHVFFIPITPTGRSAMAICVSCGHSVDPQTAGGAYNEAYTSLTPAVPVWTFTGLSLVILMIGFTLYEKQQDKQINAAQVTDCRSHIIAGKILQVGVTDNYLIDPIATAIHKYSKLIKIKAVNDGVILYYEGRMVDESKKDMTQTEDTAYFVTPKTHSILLADFNKLEILHCK